MTRNPWQSNILPRQRACYGFIKLSPAQAGIQKCQKVLDFRVRGNDTLVEFGTSQQALRGNSSPLIHPLKNGRIMRVAIRSWLVTRNGVGGRGDEFVQNNSWGVSPIKDHQIE